MHVLHISTREEMAFLAQAKDVASCEATPHHLTLSAEDYPRLSTKMQMNPPVRGADHRDAIWRGLEQGVVDVLGSDHAPHTLEGEGQALSREPVGHDGGADARSDHARPRQRRPAQSSAFRRPDQRRTAAPVRHRGKGRIAAGYDADFTIVDMTRRETIRDSWIASRSQWTPYDGKAVTGWPVGTIVRGRRVMWEGELTAPATGEAVRFW